MATYQGTTGTDTLVGADDVSDIFDFASGEWSAADSVDGGASTVFPSEVDSLWLTDGVYDSSDLANVTGIESITLYGAGQLSVGTNLIDQVIPRAHCCSSPPPSAPKLSMRRSLDFPRMALPASWSSTSSTATAPLGRHHRTGGAFEDRTGDAAEHHLAHPEMAVAAHDQNVGTLLGHLIQDVSANGAAMFRPPMAHGNTISHFCPWTANELLTTYPYSWSRLRAPQPDAGPDGVAFSVDAERGRMYRTIAVLTLVAVLAACTATVRPQATRIETSGLRVTLGGGAPSTFCPPGQAKKGRC